MSDWTAGYRADIDYTFGYYPELNPLRARLILLSRGLAAPAIRTACELGFGQGVSVNVHAAASTVDWSGTDFNPAQAAFAREMAEAFGAGTELSDESFEEFASRDDLPGFDYIGLHGIWSWISDHNRHVIVDFIRRRLNVGGVLYISYNTLPGWGSFAPVRHLLTRHAETMGSGGRDIATRVNDALQFAGKLLETKPLFESENPTVGERLRKVREKNPHYVAHEYFNQNWDPMHFSTMADWLKEARLSYAGSAHFLDHVDAINLRTEQQKFLADIPDPMFRESVRDYMVNQQFRRDYWIKGARRLSGVEQSEQLRALRVMLVQPRDEVSLKVTGSLGEASMSETVYLPLLDALADHEVRTLGDLEQTLESRDIRFAQIVQAVLILSGTRAVALVQPDEVIGRVRERTAALNRYILGKARGSEDLACLASPLTGGGVGVDRFQQLFLLARESGETEPEDWARFTWQHLDAQGRRLIKDGKTLEKPEENLAELSARAREFAGKQLPILQALQITR